MPGIARKILEARTDLIRLSERPIKIFYLSNWRFTGVIRPIDGREMVLARKLDNPIFPSSIKQRPIFQARSNEFLF
jgi:hypothetical protein